MLFLVLSAQLPCLIWENTNLLKFAHYTSTKCTNRNMWFETQNLYWGFFFGVFFNLWPEYWKHAARNITLVSLSWKQKLHNTRHVTPHNYFTSLLWYALGHNSLLIPSWYSDNTKYVEMQKQTYNIQESAAFDSL